MIDIEIPGIGTYSFPDGTTRSAIIGTIRDEFPDFNTAELKLPRPEYLNLPREDRLKQLQQFREGIESSTIDESPKPTGFERFAAGAAGLVQGAAQVPSMAAGALGALERGVVAGGEALGKPDDRLPLRYPTPDWMADNRVPPKPARESAFQKAREEIESVAESVAPIDPRTEFRPKAGAPFGSFVSDPNFWNTSVTRGVGQLGGQLALAPLGVATVVGAATAGEFTDAFDREIERQKKSGEEENIGRALLKSGTYAAAAGLIESKLGVGRLLKQFGRPTTEGIVARVARDIASGATEEGLQRTIQDIIVEGKIDPNAVAQEAVVGGIAQGIGGVPGVAVGAKEAKRVETDAEIARQTLDRRRARQEPMLKQEPAEAPFVDIPVEQVDQAKQTEQALKGANAVVAKPEAQTEQALSSSKPATVAETPAESVPPALPEDSSYAENATDEAKPYSFTEQDVLVGKPQTTSKKRENGSDITTRVEVRAPLDVTNPENWTQVYQDHLHYTVEARGQFEERKPAKKSESVWSVYRGRGQSAERIGQGLTYSEAIALAKSGVLLANPKSENQVEEAGGPVVVQEIPAVAQAEGQTQTRTPQQESEGPEVAKSLADKVVDTIDRWDAQLRENGTASDPLYLIPQVRLVLKLVRGLVRGGQTLSAAIRNAIAQARAESPSWDESISDTEIERKITEDITKEVASIGERAPAIVEDARESGASLGTEAFHSSAYRQALRDLSDLRERVAAQLLASGEDPRTAPSITDPALIETADDLGIDSGHLPSLQEAVKFERKAHAFKIRVDEIGIFSATIRNLQRMGANKHAKSIKEYQRLIDVRRRWLSKNGGAEHNDQTVAGRAAEIREQEDTRISRRAKVEALNLKPVRDAIVGPIEALKSLNNQFPEFQGRSWVQVLDDPDIPEERKAVYATAIARQVEKFNTSRKSMSDELNSEEAEIQKKIKHLGEGLSSAEDQRSLEEIVLSDARRAMAGEQGLTGNTYSRDYVEWLKANDRALLMFAQRLAALGLTDARAAEVLDWITNGAEGAPVSFRNATPGQYGVSDEMLTEIMDALSNSPGLRNAVMTLVDRAQRRLPYDRLQEIAQASAQVELAREAGDREAEDEAQAKANSLFNSLVRQSENARNKAAARATEIQDQIDALQLRLETLRNGVRMFDQVAETAGFDEFRQLADSAGQYVQQMVVQSEDQMTLKGFSAGEISQDPINVQSNKLGSLFGDNALPNILTWWRNAQAYLQAYDQAEAEWITSDGPPPGSLGYDMATVRGLRLSLEHDLPLLLDAANFDSNLRMSAGSHLLQGGWGWFRQLDATSKLVDRMFGSKFKGALSAFRNSVLKARNIVAIPQFNDMKRTRSAALRSHPELGNNQELYELQVYRPLAHEGRRFNGRAAVGMVLPSGKVVTDQDMAFLRQTQSFFKRLLAVAQERPDQGTAEEVGGRELRRSAGSVGDYGLPRHISHQTESDVLKPIAAAYAGWREGGSPPIDNQTDLSTASNHPIIAFWNRMAEQFEYLKHHALDAATRDDLTLKVHPLMRQAYRNVESEMQRGGYADRIDSVEQLVDRLVANFPSNSGLNVRKFVRTELVDELRQTASAVSDRVGLITKGRQTWLSRLQVENSNNEFTRPASRLILPGAFYSYGAMTNVDFALAIRRSTEERLVEMGVALASARNELASRLEAAERVSNPDAEALKVVADNPDDAKRWARQTLKILDRVLQDLNTDPVAVEGPLKWIINAVSFKAGAALTSPMASLNNLVLSNLTAYLIGSRINSAGIASELGRNAVVGAKTAVKTALRLIENITGVRSWIGWVKSHSPDLLRSILESTESAYKSWVLNDIQEVRGLGFSHPHSFRDVVGQAARDSVEYATNEQALRYQGPGVGRRALRGGRRIGGVAYQGASALQKAVGFDFNDLMANAGVGLALFRMLERSLKDAAARWSESHGGSDGFDPSSSDWRMTPAEYTGSPRASESVVGHVRETLNRAGLSLEFAAQDYLKRSSNGQEDVPFFNPEHEDSVKRMLISEANASSPTNRPIRSALDPAQNLLQILQGYTSDLSTKVLSAYRSVRGEDKKRKWLEGMAMTLMGLLAAMFFTLIGSSAADAFRRVVLRRLTRNLTPLDPEFWTADGAGAWRLGKLALMNIPYIGSAILTVADEVMGARGAFDIAGAALAPSLATSVLGLIRGFWTLPAEDFGFNVDRFISKEVPYAKIAQGMETYQGLNAWLNGVNGYASAAGVAGIGNISGGQSSGGVGPKTGMRSKLRDDLMSAFSAAQKGDTEKVEEFMKDAAHQRDRLVSFYFDRAKERAEKAGSPFDQDRAMKEAVASARADYLSFDPAQSAIGRKPTEDEHQKIVAGMGETRRRAFENSVSAWQRGAELFPDSKGRTPEPQPQQVERQRAIRAGSAPRGGGVAVASLPSRGGSRRIRLRGSRGRSRIRSRARVRRIRGLRLKRR